MANDAAEAPSTPLQREIEAVLAKKAAFLNESMRGMMADLLALEEPIGVERAKRLIGDTTNCIKDYELAVEGLRAYSVIAQLDQHGKQAFFDLLFGADPERHARILRSARMAVQR